MDKLPLDIVIFKIKPFLGLDKIFITNRNDYIKYKTEKYTSLTQSNKELKLNMEYITKLLRNDYNFIFEIIINIKFKIWYKPLKIKYKDMTFYSFLDFIHYKCIELNSGRCKNLINDYFKKNGIRKKKFKRIRIRNNKWTN